MPTEKKNLSREAKKKVDHIKCGYRGKPNHF
jgi:hypothetical protein